MKVLSLFVAFVVDMAYRNVVLYMYTKLRRMNYEKNI